MNTTQTLGHLGLAWTFLLMLAVSISDVQWGRPIAIILTSALTRSVPGDYPTIGQAVAVAGAGDTVVVGDGTFAEHVVVDRAIALTGAGAGLTIPNASGTGSAVVVTAAGAVVANLTVTGSGNASADAGIAVIRAPGCIVRSVNATGYLYGIRLEYTDDATVADCVASNNSLGVHLYHCHGCRIEDVIASDNDDNGVQASNCGAYGACTVLNGTNATNPDTDGDELPGGWEVQYGLDPTDTSDASLDADGDGRSNLQEFRDGTDPSSKDEGPGGGESEESGAVVPILGVLCLGGLSLLVFAVVAALLVIAAVVVGIVLLVRRPGKGKVSARAARGPGTGGAAIDAEEGTAGDGLADVGDGGDGEEAGSEEAEGEDDYVDEGGPDAAKPGDEETEPGKAAEEEGTQIEGGEDAPEGGVGEESPTEPDAGDRPADDGGDTGG